MKSSNKLICTMLCGVLLFACSKDGEQGAIGPQGEQGIQGPAGADGQDGLAGEEGPQGEQGEAGSANVIYSDWIPSDFPETINDTFHQWSMDAPELTQEIHDTGVLLVYARVGTLIYPIPITFFGNLNEQYNYRLLDINDDLIAIRLNSINGTNIGEPFLNGDYRYIIIPGGNLAGGKASTIDYGQMSYDEICERFNIPK